MQAFEKTDLEEKAHKRRQHLRRAALWIAGWIAVSFALVVGFGFVLLALFHWSFNDVLGVMLLLLAARLVPDWKVIACFLRQCRHHPDIPDMEVEPANDALKAMAPATSEPLHNAEVKGSSS